MIDYKYKNLFEQDSVHKEIVIKYDGGEIRNNLLHSENFELTQSICSANQFTLGGCEASSIKFRVSNVIDTLKNKWLTVSIIVDYHYDEPLQLGVFKVDKDTPTADRSYRDITAYDVLKDIISMDVTEWYNSMFPKQTEKYTLKEFRNSFFKYIKVEQVEAELINDDMPVTATITDDTISGKQILVAICSANASFGIINNMGKFEYRMIKENIYSRYPSDDLYPADDLYPTDDAPYLVKLYSGDYKSVKYEDYYCARFTAVRVKQESNDVGFVVGDTAGNIYTFSDNFLFYGMNAEALRPYCERILAEVKKVHYRASQISRKGNPCIEPGDAIDVHTKGAILDMNVFSRVLKGIQALFDTLEAKGEEYNSEDNNSVKNQVKSQGRLIHKFSNDLDKLESEFENTKTDMSSKIEQNEKEIKTTVKKGNVSSEISQEANSVTLKGNRLIIESDDFQLTKDGHIIINTANLKLDADGNATFSGTINGSTINGSTFKNKSITIDESSAVFNYSNNKLQVLPNKMQITTGNYSSVYSENMIILGGRDASGTTGLVLSCDSSTTGHIDINGPLYINATGGVYANGNRIG